MKPDASDDPRVRYAIERTLLAWVRTGLALMGFGFIVARYLVLANGGTNGFANDHHEFGSAPG